MPTVGFLISETPAGQESRLEALRAGLRERGYVEGKNIAIEMRSAIGQYEQLPKLTDELVRLRVDVLVAFGSKAAQAARSAGTTIPIVVPVMGDPLAIGFTSSLAGPSMNITGSAIFFTEFIGKRIELLKEIMPRLTRVALLVNAANATSASESFNAAMRATAKTLRLDLQRVVVRSSAEIPGTFANPAKGRIDAVYVTTDTLFQASLAEIANLAARQRLPSIGTGAFADAGGLIGYGVNDAEMYRRGAYFVDRLLKGAKPGDLPIEQATRFELVVNLRTAKALGIKIPQALLLRVDSVIE